MEFRIGQGFDVHRLVEGRKLFLGGVEIPNSKGLAGHSDADVLLHALADALLGALALGDIGRHFPDTEAKFHNIESIKLLQMVVALPEFINWKLANADITIIAEAPKIASYVDEMRHRIAQALQVDVDKISIKGTTTEHLGFTGRGEGIAGMAVVLLRRDKQ